MLDGADVAAEGDANRDRQRDAGAVSILRDVAHDLLERRIDEAIELDLRYRPKTSERQADRDPDDRRLGQRRIEDALLAERLLQAVRDPKDPAQRAHVLAKDQDVLIAGQGIAQREVYCSLQRHRFCQLSSSEASNSSRS